MTRLSLLLLLFLVMFAAFLAFDFAWKSADGEAFDVGVLSFCLSVAFVLCNDSGRISRSYGV